MKFITRTELLTYIDNELLSQLTNNDNDILDNISEFAISEICGYISGKYNVDEIFNKTGLNRNAYFVSITMDILLFHLYSRSSSNNIPDIRIQKYSKAIEYLESVGKGTITPDLPVKSKEFNTGSSELLWGNMENTDKL